MPENFEICKNCKRKVAPQDTLHCCTCDKILCKPCDTLSDLPMVQCMACYRHSCTEHLVGHGDRSRSLVYIGTCGLCDARCCLWCLGQCEHRVPSEYEQCMKMCCIQCSVMRLYDIRYNMRNCKVRRICKLHMTPAEKALDSFVPSSMKAKIHVDNMSRASLLS